MTAPLSPAEATRAGALYVPVLLALVAGIWRRARPIARMFPATLLAGLWTLPSLLLLQQLNLRAQWWSYAPGSAASLSGMPLELYLGWAVLWGIVPALVPGAGAAGAKAPLGVARLFVGLKPHASTLMNVGSSVKPGASSLPTSQRPERPGASGLLHGAGYFRILISAVVLFGFDLVMMPACKAAVTLGPGWLWGEAVALGLVLLPALVLAVATERNTHLGLRATLQLVLAAGLFLYWIPEVTFALSHTHARAIAWRVALPVAVLLALPGLGGILEFAQRGRGTPIPYDPPVRLVTSGIYRYLANPMQLSCVLVMLAWAALLRNAWLLVPALFAVVYSAGIAAWDEGEDLRLRFGQGWVEYRKQVHDWLPRLAPYHAGPPARLYYAHSCVACSQVGRWLAARRPVGLELLAAESLTQTPQRLMYVPVAGAPEHGTRAFARALEHVHLGYALGAIALRLPGPAHLVQLVMDASGFGPQVIAGACELEES